MRRLLGLTVLAFAVGLGAVVGYRMSSEAMAVVVGVICGVLASIPMSLLILIVTRRFRGRRFHSACGSCLEGRYVGWADWASSAGMGSPRR